MRRLLVALPLLLVAACAAPDTTAEDQGSSTSNISKDETSVAWGRCAYTREEILSTVSPARGAVITRGFAWLDADVPFSSAARHEGYRTDCSGFVSMCFELGAPGKTTREFGNAGSGTSKLSSYDDLVPADALVDAGKHSVIFLGWNDAAKTGACVLEQSSTKNDMQFRVRMTATLKNDGFFPVRSNNLADDTAYTSPTPATADDGSGTACVPRPAREICLAAKTDDGLECGRVSNGCGGTVDCSELSAYTCATGSTCRANTCVATPATPTTPTTTPTPTPTTCTPKATATLCREARARSYVECGPISDGCGGTVSCDEVSSFGCSTDPAARSTCQANRCVPTTCIAKATATLCEEARAKNDVECGWISDGCGGTVSCDAVAGFGCSSGRKCGLEAMNRCPATPSTDTATGDVKTSPEMSPAADEDQGDTNEPTMPRSAKGARDMSTGPGGCSATPSATLGNAPFALVMMALGGLLRRRSRRTHASS